MDMLLWGAIIVLFIMVNNAKREIKEIKSIISKDVDINSLTIANKQELVVDPVDPPQKTKHAEDPKEETNSKIKDENGIFLGQKLITWLAGIAAILGAFYFVKYSIDIGLIGPKARLCIATLIGFCFIISGMILWPRRHLSNNERIAQTLIGVGIATLYFAAYGAAKIYGFIPLSTSFMLMCAVTLSAIILSLRYGGVPVAILGLIGGFLTPALVSSSQSGVISFSSYLFIIVFAFLFLAKRFASTLIILLCLFAMYGWIFIWMFVKYNPYDSGWLMALVTISTVTVFLLFPASQNSSWKKIQNFAVCSGVFLGFCFLIKTNFGLFEWGILGLLLTGTIVLTLIKPKEYIHIFIATLGLSYLLLAYFRYELGDVSLLEKQLIYVGLTILGFLPLYISLWIKKNTSFLSFIAVFAPLSYALYYILFGDHNIYPYIGFAYSLILALPIFTLKLSNEQNQKEASIYTLSAFSILTIALANLLDADFWPIVLAIEILIVGSLQSLTKIKKLDFGIWTLFALFIINQIDIFENVVTLILSEQLNNLKFYSLDLDTKFFVSNLLIPTIAFSVLSFVSKNNSIKGVFGTVSGLLGLYGFFAFYMLIRMKFDEVDSAYPTFGEHTFITNILLLASLGSIYLKNNKAFCIVLGIGLWRVIFINLFMFSPLTNKIDLNLINIVFAYSVPLIVTSIFAYKTQDRTKNLFSWLGAAFSFVLVSFIILYGFYETLYLQDIHLTNNGVFAFSAGWLILGAIWLAFAFRNKALVMPAFGLIYFVIAKVFLYDVSSLDGIWRVTALFGLAGSLLGISHFYAKYFQAPKIKRA